MTDAKIEEKMGYIKSLEKKVAQGDQEAQLMLGMTHVLLCSTDRDYTNQYGITKEKGYKYLADLALNSDNTKEGRCAAAFLAASGRNSHGEEDGKIDCERVAKDQLARLGRLLQQEHIEIKNYPHGLFVEQMLPGKEEIDMLRFADRYGYPLALHLMGSRLEEGEVKGAIRDNLRDEERVLAWYNASRQRFTRAADAGFEPAAIRLQQLIAEMEQHEQRVKSTDEQKHKAKH